MKHPITPRALLLLLPALALAASCSGGSNHDGTVFVPATYPESEVNDVAPMADYFGLLRPGDFFYIEGHISDIPFDPFDPWNGHDPFDGFAFTANEPVHVQFRLFIDDPYADLDVIVYDPQIGFDVGWFATANNPETGAVDVYGYGLDFHLVVESWVGSSSYTMEIEVFELYLTEEEDGEGVSSEEPLASITANRIIDPIKEEDAAERIGMYHAELPDDPAVQIETSITEIDQETGLETEISHTLDADG
jgi:hypothetical protein